MENHPARVLIIDTAWLGDVVFSTALVGATRQVWPEAEIHFLTAPRAQAIMTEHPQIHRLWVFDKHGAQRAMNAVLTLADELNQVRFDVVLCAHPSLRSRLLCARLAAPVRVGYTGFGERWAFTHTAHNSLAIEPDHVERRLNLLRALVPVTITPPLRIGLNATERSWADDYLKQLDGTDQPLLGLVPGSARLTKQWGVEQFIELARIWCKRTGGRTLAVLGPTEAPMRPHFEKSGQPIQVVESGLRQCAALLQRCHSVVGNDTGVSFVAIAAGAPRVVVLYGSTQVNYRFPAPHRAIAAGVPCCLPRTGHGQARCKWTGDAPWCMSQISQEQVLQHILPGP
ncbi:MAG: glycosyltransferase family 9 protein [bacterium]|nr:glycosyltransferase family 9 protein [bacterium]